MTDTLRIKRRLTGLAGAPSSLLNAELAYNEVDHSLYYGEGSSGGTATNVVPIGGRGAFLDLSSSQSVTTGTKTFSGAAVVDGSAASVLVATQAADTNTTAAASTAFVLGQGFTGTPNMDGTAAAGSSTRWARGDHVHPSDTSRAPLASPAFTGTPTGPTAANGTNTTQLATTAYVLATRLDQLAVPAGPVSFNSQKLTNLATPTNPQDAATKLYVDSSVQGLQVKPTANVATASALPSNTYANGTAGVGATLTATANALLTVDGVGQAVGNLVLVKNEATAANNGLYTVTAAGSGSAAYVLTRQVDMNAAGAFSGAFVPVGAGGTANANTLWLCNPSGTVTVGTTSIPFTELNGATSVTAGNGISIAGNVVSAVGTTNRISTGTGIDIAASYVGQSSITTLGTITSGVWNGTTVAVGNGGTGAATLTGYLSGNGTAAFTASATIPSTAITGLGTMSTQSSAAVTITGGTIDGVTFDMGTF